MGQKIIVIMVNVVSVMVARKVAINLQPDIDERTFHNLASMISIHGPFKLPLEDIFLKLLHTEPSSSQLPAPTAVIQT